MFETRGIEDYPFAAFDFFPVPVVDLELVEVKDGLYSVEHMRHRKNRLRRGIRIYLIAFGGVEQQSFPFAAKLGVKAPFPYFRRLKSGFDLFRQNFLVHGVSFS